MHFSQFLNLNPYYRNRDAFLPKFKENQKKFILHHMYLDTESGRLILDEQKLPPYVTRKDFLDVIQLQFKTQVFGIKDKPYQTHELHVTGCEKR